MKRISQNKVRVFICKSVLIDVCIGECEMGTETDHGFAFDRFSITS